MSMPPARPTPEWQKSSLETYDAVAVEWLLLGLVELPPPGVITATARGENGT